MPSDWIYVYDFQKKDTPKAILLKAGEGKRFALLMRSFISDLRIAIPSALHSEDYERTVNTIMSHSSEKQAKKYNELEKIAHYCREDVLVAAQVFLRLHNKPLISEDNIERV